jgi:hypothetical protein
MEAVVARVLPHEDRTLSRRIPLLPGTDGARQRITPMAIAMMICPQTRRHTASQYLRLRPWRRGNMPSLSRPPRCKTRENALLPQ